MFDLVDNTERRERIRFLIEQMREIIRDYFHTENETIIELEIQYIDEVKSVNNDLQACSQLLKKGLIPSVKQRAQECDLLSRYNLLGSLDRDAWLEILEIAEYKPSDVKLDRHTEKEINNCFDSSDRLEPHYREIRRLALCRAGLRNRLAEMRKVFVLLRKNDLGTQEWSEDIKAFEVEREKELFQEIKNAKSRLELGELGQLIKELSPKKWLNPPSPGLRQEAKDAYRDVAKVVSIQRLEQLGEEMIKLQQSNKVEKDIQQYYPKLTTMLGQWAKCLDVADLPPGDHRVRPYESAHKYIQSVCQEYNLERQIRSMIDEVNHAIDIEAVLKEIEPKRNHLATREKELRQLSGGLDEALEIKIKDTFDRYDTYESSINRKRGHRWKLQLVGAVSSVIAASVLIFWIVQTRQIESAYVSRESQLQQLVESKKVAETDQFLESAGEQEDEFLSRPKVKALIAEHEKTKGEELSRQARVASTLQGIMDDVDRAAALSQIHLLRNRLKDVEADIILQREMSSHADTLAAIAEKQSLIQENIDKSFSERFQQVTDELAAVSPKDMNSLKSVERKLSELKSTPDVSQELMSQVPLLISRVTSMVDSENMRLSEVDGIRKINEAVGSPARFETQLKGYITKFQGSGKAAQFEEVLKQDVPVWIEILEWNRTAAEWKRRDISSPTREQAAKYVELAQEALNTHKNDSRAKVLQNAIPYLKAIQARTQGEETIKDRLLELLKNPAIQIPYSVSDTKGNLHYTDEIPLRSSNRYQFKYFTGLDVSEKKFKAFEPEEISLHRQGTRIIWTSPQMIFSENITTKLSSLSDISWDSQMFAVLERTAADTRMDPLLKVILLQAIGELVKEGSLPLQVVLEPVFKQIEEAAIPTEVNYIDPEDAEGITAREKAERFTKTLPSFIELRRQMMKKREDLSKLDFGPAYQWIGWLNKNNDSQWVVESLRPSLDGGDLLVTSIPEGEGKFRLEKIGVTKPGQYVIDDDVSAEILLQGRAVFLVVDK